jgi:hypothetical protein
LFLQDDGVAKKPASKESAPRDPHRPEVEAALARVRTALEASGVLLRQDLALPCVTTLIVGEAIRGSWWAHPENKLIYDTLGRLEDETAHVKLLNEKVTLVHRRLWPELVAIGRSRADWQLRALTVSARKLLDQVARPLRADEFDVDATGKERHALIAELERNLLVHAYDLHTERGFHVRVIEPWSAWQKAHDVKGKLPAASSAMKTIERAVEGWAHARLPWS